MLVFTKSVMILLAIISSFSLWEMHLSGNAIAKEQSRRLKNNWAINEYRRRHRQNRKVLFIVTLLTIVLVEVIFRFFLHKLHFLSYPPVVWIHLVFFAIPFTVLFVTLGIFKTGTKSRRLHMRLAPWCIRLGWGTNILGAIIPFIIF
jgi:magnesium-transporting ATPase (P-type)